MKATAIMAMAAVAGITARAGRNVTVYLTNDLNTGGVMYQAQEKAAKAFAEVGVRNEWHTGRPPATQPEREPAIMVRLATGRTRPKDTPADYMPGALALARVYEGVHITVFWDRIESQCRLAPSLVVLAHVSVHEITHILQGVNRHSESGVMKSRWTVKDQRAMASRPLPFTPLDVELIRHALESRKDTGARAGANSVLKTTD
jgi:hypothetical protein